LLFCATWAACSSPQQIAARSTGGTAPGGCSDRDIITTAVAKKFQNPELTK
jgi:hypothetical protein